MYNCLILFFVCLEVPYRKWERHNSICVYIYDTLYTEQTFLMGRWGKVGPFKSPVHYLIFTCVYRPTCTILPALTPPRSTSLLCSDARHSCIGILEKVWTRWSSLRLNPIWMIWCLSTSSIRMQLLKRRVNSMRRRENMMDEPRHKSALGKSCFCQVSTLQPLTEQKGRNCWNTWLKPHPAIC